MRARQLLIIVPLAAMVGIGAAFSLYLLVDRSHSKLPAFQVELAKQNPAQSVANHSPTTSAPERRAKRLAEMRRQRAIRRARRARSRAASSAAAAARSRSASAGSQSAPAATAAPAPTPVYRPAPVSRPAPKPASAPKRSSGGGGGGSFDDSG